jgi:hypothetical protein
MAHVVDWILIHTKCSKQFFTKCCLVVSLLRSFLWNSYRAAILLNKNVTFLQRLPVLDGSYMICPGCMRIEGWFLRLARLSWCTIYVLKLLESLWLLGCYCCGGLSQTMVMVYLVYDLLLIETVFYFRKGDLNREICSKSCFGCVSEVCVDT